jgi:hypothetical protein
MNGRRRTRQPDPNHGEAFLCSKPTPFESAIQQTIEELRFNHNPFFDLYFEHPGPVETVPLKDCLIYDDKQEPEKPEAVA